MTARKRKLPSWFNSKSKNADARREQETQSIVETRTKRRSNRVVRTVDYVLSEQELLELAKEVLQEQANVKDAPNTELLTHCSTDGSTEEKDSFTSKRKSCKLSDSSDSGVKKTKDTQQNAESATATRNLRRMSDSQKSGSGSIRQKHKTDMSFLDEIF